MWPISNERLNIQLWTFDNVTEILNKQLMTELKHSYNVA